MTYLQAIILGVVEGLTEFLPVSSTGHLILASNLLGLQDDKALHAYQIVIQLGAILAVLALYKNRALEMLQGLLGRNPVGLRLFLMLIVAFLPAAILGKLFDEMIDNHLFGPYPVVAALIVGGIVMILIEQILVKPREKKSPESMKGIDQLNYNDALIIGLFQCCALWPGTSRSMSTIVGAQVRRFSSIAAAEISFLLALPTLGAATLYKLVKERDALLAMPNATPLIIMGNIVAFVIAFFTVKLFVRFVTRWGMTPFGVYRIAIGIVFLWAAANGLL
ncbi:undecaprenyl-diphosphate phosphatase [Candidatus Sumerlaeota bacterium]|nr:undecaprenyl-diphosphate phosphatase [Candidatus Sumerlaeota bacterium]